MGSTVLFFAGLIEALWATSAVFKYGVYLVASYGLSRYVRSRAESPGDQMGQDVAAQGGTVPVGGGYGETVTPGVLADIRIDNNSADKVYDLHQLFHNSWRDIGATANNRRGIAAVVGWYLNDDYVSNTPANLGTHGIQTGPWNVDTGLTKAVFVKSGRGNQVATPGVPGYSDRPHLLGETFRQWRTATPVNSEMVGVNEGCSYTHWRFRLHKDSQKLFASGPPRCRTRQREAFVYDPRLDGTRTGGSGAHRFASPNTWAWSDNPALAYADYRTQYTGTPDARMDWASIMAAADFCDELVAIPGGTMEKRYRCDVHWNGGVQHKDNISAILDSFNAQQVYASGRYKLIIPQAQAASYAFTEANVIGQVTLTTDRPVSEEVTRVSGRIRSRDHLYTEIDFPARENTALKAQLGGVGREISLALPGVSRQTQAQRLANGILQEQRMRESIVVPLNWQALALTVGDRFTLVYPLLGYDTPKKWRVIELELGGDAAPVVASAVEDADDIYADLPVAQYHTFDASERIDRAEGAPLPAENFIANGTSSPGEILWAWDLPDNVFDTVELYVSADSAWANASKVWEGAASAFVQTRISGADPAGRTRFGWIRVVRSGVQSIRTPDDDVSSVSAEAGEAGTVSFVFGASELSLYKWLPGRRDPPVAADLAVAGQSTYDRTSGAFTYFGADGWATVVDHDDYDPFQHVLWERRLTLAGTTDSGASIGPSEWGGAAVIDALAVTNIIYSRGAKPVALPDADIFNG